MTIQDLFDIIALALLYIFVFYRRWRAKGKDILLINTAFYTYLVCVFYFTLMPIITSLPFIFNHPYTPMNLEPFIDVTAQHGDFMRQIILNIIMMIPFGFLFPLTALGKFSFIRTLLVVFLLSFTIEIIQPLINSRSSDITDIITNVFGGLIGYLLFLIFRPLTQKFLTLFREAPIPDDPSPE